MCATACCARFLYRRRRRAADRAGTEGRKGSSLDGRSSSTPAQRHAFFGTAARQEFFSLYREQERLTTLEGDDAIRPDSARSKYLECAMRQASVPLCRIVIQLRNYSGPVQLEHGRLLRLPPIDATALITQVKSQIRDYLRLPVGRQILLYDGVPLQNEGTVAGYGLHRLPPPVLLQLAFEELEPELEADADESSLRNLSSRQGGGGGTSMLATLAQAYQENEPLARARLMRARTGVEFTNPDTGHSKLFSATQLPLPILIQKDERETRRLYATLVPQMSHAEALSACELAGLPVAQSTPLTALQSALTVHLNRQNGSSSRNRNAGLCTQKH